MGNVALGHLGSFRGWLRMPNAILLEVRAFKADERGTAGGPLPPLEDYVDARDAERIKKRLPYRLGHALLKYGRSPLRWPMVPIVLQRAATENRKRLSFQSEGDTEQGDRKADAAGHSRKGRRIKVRSGRPAGDRGAASSGNGAATSGPATATNPLHYYRAQRAHARPPLEQLVSQLAAYDVISFDIFDTAIQRAVSKPTDVFRIVAARVGVTGFVKKRKDAEAHARLRNDRLRGTREVTLHEIYEVLAERYAAAPEWEQLEKDLEIELARGNPYIREVYERLRKMGKTIIFTTDMYLPVDTLAAMLTRAGYHGYRRIWVSNEHGARKGDGTLQQILLAEYGRTGSIVHVGDVYDADVVKSIAAGIGGVHYLPARDVLAPEYDMASLAGSFYEAVINNTLGAGGWSNGLHYTHGFRVGGILALGYVEFLERLAKDKGADKILFLGRDCDILFQVYQKFLGGKPSAYVGISRAAALMLTARSNYDEYIVRTFFRWYKESNNSRPLRQLLSETGFGYLVDHLEDEDIEPFQFPASANEAQIRDFFWRMKGVVEAHLAGTVDAARRYFGDAIGGSKKVLVVDVGWSGTCILTLRDFFRDNFGDAAPDVVGALLVTARNELVSDAVSNGVITPFVYSPTMNQDIARVVMPNGNISQRQKDMLSHPVEYLFTEPLATTIGYAQDENGAPEVLRGSNTPPNPEQIRDMQRGIVDFVERYLDYSRGLTELRAISSYVAFQPLRNALGQRPYLYAVYKDFLYDAAPVLHGDVSVFERFGGLFDFVDRSAAEASGARGGAVAAAAGAPRILFVSPEMLYVGAPRSLLRLCRIALSLGYEPVVWTAKLGPFAYEFEALGIHVHVVPDSAIDQGRIDHLVRDNIKLVVCNTVATDGYVRALEGRLPVVWYVREATNVPQFLRGNKKRAETLQVSASIAVVSDYAAEAVSKHADGPIDVVKNAVEDVSELALPYEAAVGGVVRFVQLGTIEHRKGYDLLIAAFKALPDDYRRRAEIHFAGGFINSGTSFASYIFGQIRDEPGIHYHGLIANDRRKVELVSQMDVVVVASRDESCSLVALEGAMLSKPLVLTENVGAKYMVGEDNGLIIATGDVAAMRGALMRMIDMQPGELVAMGAASRRKYEERASMAVHRRELGELFARRIAAGPATSKSLRNRGRAQTAEVPAPQHPDREIVVSLTSFPPRIPTLAKCIESLKRQSRRPDRILLWLSEDQFPEHGAGLPAELHGLVDQQFQIRWVEGDLAPHKKYFYTMQEYPDALVIIVDDDVRYDKDLVASLYEGHLARPASIVAARSNLIRFRPDGTPRAYEQWGYEHNHLREVDTYALLPTGVGGVLYPPGSVPRAAFDMVAIKATSLRSDDLWLKVMTAAHGFPVWMPLRKFTFDNLPGSQGSALWRVNSFRSGNDIALRAILDFVEERYGIADALLRRIRGVRADGTFVGPGDELERFSLLGEGGRDSQWR